MKSLEFTDYVELYFRQYAPEQRGLSSHTISSYSDAILLFFRYYDLKHNIKPNNDAGCKCLCHAYVGV